LSGVLLRTFSFANDGNPVRKRETDREKERERERERITDSYTGKFWGNSQLQKRLDPEA
jgi:hypothetical protein